MESVDALLGTLIVLVVPGALLAALLRWRLRSVTTWACVPVLSVGVVFVVAEFMTSIGARFGLPAFGGAVGLLAIGLILLAWRDRMAQLRASRSWKPRARPSVQAAAGGVDEDMNRVRSPRERAAAATQTRLSAGLLALGIVFGLMIWVHGMHGLALVPPQIDSANHGFFVARIAHTGSIDSSKVVVTDPDGASKVADFYPLGMHASAAIAAELTGAPVGRVLIDFVVLFSSVVFPLGMFALARLLAPQRVLLAGLTAFLTPFLALWAYPAMQLGLLALMVGMAMVPVSAVVVAQSLGVGSVLKGLDGLRVLVPSALVVVAVTAVHPSEVPTLMLLVTALLVGHFWRRWRAVVNVLGRGLALDVHRSPVVVTHALWTRVGRLRTLVVQSVRHVQAAQPRGGHHSDRPTHEYRDDVGRRNPRWRSPPPR